MGISSLFKYSFRFLFLQIILSYLSIYYFNTYLLSDTACEQCVGNSFAMQIDSNLWEDRNRFFPFINEELVTINVFLVLFIFLFLVILYSTKFYTYVNELSYSLDRSYLDEYISIYLLWTSSLFVFLTFFRVAHLISRGYLVLFTFLVPIILLLFRNSEFISSLLGRSVTNENYVTFNLEQDSLFRNLRIMTFRKSIKDFVDVNLNDSKLVIDNIDAINKEINLNLIVINVPKTFSINEDLEEYLINLNKKVLIISSENLKFQNYFLKRSEIISDYYLTYFNNDIQYGSKYILKRAIDIIFSILGIISLFPLILITYFYIFIIDGRPVIIKQARVGLHGKQFNMYKFRTMYKNSHEIREELQDLNKNDEVIFKIEDDPRIIKGAHSLRKYSLDEIPQFINVLKGEMSIVGPRPLFDEDTKLFDKNYMRRLNVLPGITGLLQINERNTSEFSTWYRYDIEYIENWSLYLDLKIIFKTPLSLLRGRAKGL